MGMPSVACRYALGVALVSVAWISTSDAALAGTFQSCNGLSGTITPNFLTLNNGLRGTSGQFNVTDGDVISGTVSGLDPNITASARLAQPGLTTRRVFFTNGVGGTFSFTINVAAREASFGQQVAELFLYANAGATATFNCVGTLNQPADDDGTGGDSSSSDGSGGPGYEAATWTGASDGYVIGQFAQNDADDWTSIQELESAGIGDLEDDQHDLQLEDRHRYNARLQRQRDELQRQKDENTKKINDLLEQAHEFWSNIVGTRNDIQEMLEDGAFPGGTDWSLVSQEDQDEIAARWEEDLDRLEDLLRRDQERYDLLAAEAAIFQEENELIDGQIKDIDASISSGSAPGRFYAAPYSVSEHSTPPFGWLPAAKKQARLPFHINAISPDENTDIANFSARFADEHLYGWIGGNYTWTRDRRTGNNTDRHAVRVEAGLLYKYSSVVDLGGKVRLTYGSSARLDGTSTTGALAIGASTFARIKLPQGILLTPVIAYERSSTGISFNSGAATGNFATDIFMVGATLSKRFRPGFATHLNQAYIEPNMSLSLIHGIRHGYTLSSNTAIVGASFTQGTLRFGPTIGWRLVDSGETFASVDHTVSLNGTWNFLRPASFTSASGAQVSTPEFSASINAALSAKTYRGKTLSLGIGYSGIGSMVQSASISGSISIPLN
ncbi:MAG: hypothetical protein JJ969_12760 [Rhizobiaceae bacterium]|nr:hypothetical protein [Rhizobiaceae bacterium]